MINNSNYNYFFNRKDEIILYPSSEKIVEYVAKISDSITQNLIEDVETDDSSINASQIEQLRLLGDQDPLHQLHEQERKTI